MKMSVSNPYENTDWDQFRDFDGNIDLASVLESQGCDFDNPAVWFVNETAKITPIRSRQVAALTLMTAIFFASMEDT